MSISDNNTTPPEDTHWRELYGWRDSEPLEPQPWAAPNMEAIHAARQASTAEEALKILNARIIEIRSSSMSPVDKKETLVDKKEALADRALVHALAGYLLKVARDPNEKAARDQCLKIAHDRLQDGLCYRPHDAYMIHSLGEVAYEQGNYQEALGCFEKIIALHEKYPHQTKYNTGASHAWCAHCHLELGNFKQALLHAEIRIADRDNPRFIAVGHTLAGKAHIGLGDFAKALEHANILIADVDPKSVAVGHTLAGKAHIRLGNFAQALEHANILIADEDNPESVVIGHTFAAQACIGLGDFTQALKHANKKIADDDPRSVSAGHTFAAQACIGLGDFTQALGHANILIADEDNPKSVAVGHTLAMNGLLRRGAEGDAKLASEHLEKLKEIDPSSNYIPIFSARIDMAKEKWLDACEKLTALLMDKPFHIAHAHMLRYAAHKAAHSQDYAILVRTLSAQGKWQDEKGEALPLRKPPTPQEEKQMLEKIANCIGRYSASPIVDIVEKNANGINAAALQEQGITADPRDSYRRPVGAGSRR